MKKIVTIVLLLVITQLTVFSQKLAGFEVDLNRQSNGLDQPASINLDEVSFVPDSLLSLVEVVNGKRIDVPFQIVQEKNRRLYWMIHSATNAGKKRVFELVKGSAPKFAQISAVAKDGSLTIEADNKNLLRYWYSTVYPPAGIDSAFRRSGFIHPLWTPHGQELTRIQAPDHYHHYGIWNPWTHVLFEGDTLDFWNLKGKKGTVRFGKFASVTNGSIFSEFRAIHEHVAFKKDKTEKVALNELQTVRVYRPEPNQDYFISRYQYRNELRQ